MLGGIFWLFGSRSRHVTLRNIDLAYGDLAHEGRACLARKSFISTTELMAEMGWVWLRPWKEVQGRIKKVFGSELITDALRTGRGVVVLAPHLGNWEVLGLHLGLLGSVVSLYEPPKLEGLGDFISTARQKSGAKLVPTNKRGLASLIVSLREGHIAGILPDQVPTQASSGENADFMGIPCFTGTLASNIIRRTNALAVFGFAQRTKDGFTIRYLAASDSVYSKDTLVSVTAVNTGVEKCIGFCPDQYQWEYKRFRTYPREISEVYQK